MNRKSRVIEKEESGVSHEVTKSAENGHLLVDIKEMLVWSKLSRGEYNRNQAYSHVVVTPSVPWTVQVPVDSEGPDALKQALSVLQDAVHSAVLNKVAELEQCDKDEAKRQTSESLSKHGVEVNTSIRSIQSRPPVRSSIEAAVGDPVDDNEDF